MVQLQEAKTCRIEIPKDFSNWIADPVNQQFLADEYNALVKFLHERETLLEARLPQHAGYVVFQMACAHAMGAIQVLPEKMGDRIMEIAEGLLEMATPTLTKEQHE